MWLCWVFVSVRGLSPVAASGGHSSSRCAGLSLLRPLLLRNTGSRRAGSQQLWLTGLVAPRHVGSSQSRARTRVPCIGRQILNHCATREAHSNISWMNEWLKILKSGTSLAVQWLRLRATSTGSMGSIPGRGTKIPHAVRPKEKKYWSLSQFYKMVIYLL